MWWCFWLTIFLAMGWYPCCCPGSPMNPCSPYCTTGTTPPTVSIVVTGVANDTCDDCGSINGTWIGIQQVRTVQYCRWIVPTEFLSCTGTGPDFFNLEAKTATVLSTYRWFSRLGITHTDSPSFYTNSEEFTWDSGGTAAFDCSANRTLTAYFSATGTACDVSGLGIEVRPN